MPNHCVEKAPASLPLIPSFFFWLCFCSSSRTLRGLFCFLQAFAFFTEEGGGTDVEKKNLSEEEIVAKLMPDSLKAGANNVDGFDIATQKADGAETARRIRRELGSRLQSYKGYKGGKTKIGPDIDREE